jgi:uncharacterized protein (TIGR03437 family)
VDEWQWELPPSVAMLQSARALKLENVMFRLIVLVTAASVSTASGQIANYVGSAGYSFSNGMQVAPGQVISLFVQGLSVPDAVASKVPWPTTLSGVSVTVPSPPNASYPTVLPIFSVSSYSDACSGGLLNFCNTTDIVVQVPYEPVCIPNGFPNACTLGPPPPVVVAVQVNGVPGQGFYLYQSGRGAAPHFLNSCDSIYGRPSGNCNQLATHADGTLVGAFGWPGVSPAHPSEPVTIYAVGLGSTANSKTGQAVSTPDPLPTDVYLTPAILLGSSLQFGTALKADWAGLIPSFVGLYQINVHLPVTIPSEVLPCDSAEGGNVRLFFGDQIEQDTANTTPFTDICMATN